MNELLRDLVTEITGRDAEGLTTGKAAQALLAHAKQDPALLTTGVTDWLKHANQAAQERNKVMHAVAEAQCVLCGNATRFEHKGKTIDRSAGTVAAVSAELRDLIDEAVRHARDISRTLNEHAKTVAAQQVAATGKIQSPKQILIGQTFNKGIREAGGVFPEHLDSARNRVTDHVSPSDVRRVGRSLANIADHLED